MFKPTRQDLIRQKVNMKSYLSQLEELLGRAINTNELSSLEKVVSMQQDIQGLLCERITTYETTFADLREEIFANFIKRLRKSNPSKVYVWTRHTIDCGALTLPSIESILNLNFEVIFEHEGLIYFRTENLCDMISLDFDLSPEGQKKMIIETQGEWAKVSYF